MANAQVLYNESVAATTAATTTWVDVASIAAASFTAGKTYLIIANEIAKINSAADELRVRLVHGTTPTVFDDASLAHENRGNDQEHEVSYMFLYTQPGTTELVKLQISSSATSTVTNILSQIIAIKLSDDFASGTDYFWNEFLTDYTMTGTPTAKAVTASFTPNGTDRWLFVGHMIYDVVGITTQIGFELYDSVAGVLNSAKAEGEDGTNDFKGFNVYWAGVPSNAARTLAVRPFDSGSAIMLASRVIAINLSKFAQSASAFDATEVDPATSPSWTTVATVAPTPSNTGDWVVIAFLTQDVNETSTDWETRLQINASGGGLADDPPYTNTPPGNDNWDAQDEPAHSIFNLVSLSSGGARTINFDVRQTVGTTGRVEDNGLVAFSVALAASGQTVAVGQSIETDTAQATGKQKVKAVGQNTETDLAQAIAEVKRLALAQSLETDTAQAISSQGAILVQQVQETDLAQSLFPRKLVMVAQAVEIDLAQSISSDKIKVIGQVTEMDLAQAIVSGAAVILGIATLRDHLVDVASLADQRVDVASVINFLHEDAETELEP